MIERCRCSMFRGFEGIGEVWAGFSAYFSACEVKILRGGGFGVMNG